MGIPIGRSLQTVIMLVVIGAIVLLVFSYNHGSHAATEIAHAVVPSSLLQEYPKVKHTPQAQATIVTQSQASPAASPIPCQVCQERRERYRAAMLNPQIILRPNTLEIGR